MTFTTRLKALSLSRAELARRLGLEAETVYRWKNDPPQYALAYVELLETMQRAARMMQSA
jgi:transcriptional regulator with XRE-family HTH domain